MDNQDRFIVQDSRGNSLTFADMQGIIRKEVSKFYNSYKVLQADYEVDDIVDEVCLYYLSPMKRTGEIRLEHYVNTHPGDINYLKNLLKLTSRQWLNCVVRDKHIKHKELSLNSIISNADDKVVELQDLIADDSIDIEAKVQEKDFLVGIVKDLREYNVMYLYNKAKVVAEKKNKTLTQLEFICNTHNLIDVHKLTEAHLNLIKDLIAGYKSKELKVKYKDYAYLINGVKQVLSKRYLISD